MLLVNETENELNQIKLTINKIFNIRQTEFTNKVSIHEDETYGNNVNNNIYIQSIIKC